jgi:hypothetical protein
MLIYSMGVSVDGQGVADRGASADNDRRPADGAAPPWRHRDVLVSADAQPQPVLLPQLEQV